MYGRDYGERELNFEASGGLMHASLVMQDKETDTYWSIMTGDAVAGEFRGTRLVELPYGSKATWRDWKRQHPETLVLSVDGAEHAEHNPYDNYFTDSKSFRGAEADDARLATKEAIYSFQLGGRAYAVPFAEFTGGGTFEVAGKHLFLYRPEGAAIFASTVAYISTEGGFTRRDGVWRHASGAVFDPVTERFDARDVPRLDGFDTFWFNWSMTHPETEVVRRSPDPDRRSASRGGS